MDRNKHRSLKAFYRNELVSNTVPFWTGHAVDTECGGLYSYLSRTGVPVDTDKGMWVQARAVWLFASLYRRIEPRESWLATAAHALRFLERNGFDADGRMFFLVDRCGRPVRKRRYVFTEIFTVMAYAAFGKARSDSGYLDKAVRLANTIEHWIEQRSMLEAKIDPRTRALRSHSLTMIRINMYQVLRDATDRREYDARIDALIAELCRLFVKREQRAVLETVRENGEMIDTPEGRTVNPGHSIETATFLLEEAHRSGKHDLMRLGLDILDWSIELGRDTRHGGLFYFVDLAGGQAPALEWDMKLWWVHAEALYALLQAAVFTGDPHYEQLYDDLHTYTWSRFPDRKHGEWYGYLHRDGTIALDYKANHWKGPFHVPRQQMNIVRLLDEG